MLSSSSDLISSLIWSFHAGATRYGTDLMGLVSPVCMVCSVTSTLPVSERITSGKFPKVSLPPLCPSYP